MTMEEAVRILEINVAAMNALHPDAAAAQRELRRQTRANYRRIALRVHPDQGGSHEEVIRVTEARDLLLRAELRPRRQQSTVVPYMTGGGVRVFVTVHSPTNSTSQSFANGTMTFTSAW